jgi:hypothetical protein
MAETLFEQLAKPDEPIERLRATNELNQQIDVAIGPRGPVQHRTKEGEPCDTEGTNLVFHGTESLLDTFSGERRRGHAHQCTEILAFGQVVAETPNVSRSPAAAQHLISARLVQRACWAGRSQQSNLFSPWA